MKKIIGKIALIAFAALLAVAGVLPPGESLAGAKKKLGDTIELGTWWYSCLGSMKFMNTGFDAQTNFEKDGGLSRNNNTVFKYDLNLNDSAAIVLQAAQAINQGELKVYGQNSVSINGVTFGSGTAATVKTTVKLTDADILFTRHFQFLEIMKNKLHTEVMGGLKFYRVTIDMQDTASASKNYYVKKLSIPQIGFRSYYKIRDNLSYFVSMNGSVW